MPKSTHSVNCHSTFPLEVLIPSHCVILLLFSWNHIWILASAINSVCRSYWGTLILSSL